MENNKELIKKIKSNKVLQKEMLKYNSMQWEMYFLYAVSGVLLLISFAFAMSNYALGYITMLLVIVVNIFIILLRNKIVYIANCKIKDIFQPFESLSYKVVLEETGEKHTDIFKYKKNDNYGRKKINGFEGIVFTKISNNPNRWSKKQRTDFFEELRNYSIDDEKYSELLKMAEPHLVNTSIQNNDKVIAFKTVSGYVYAAKEEEI